MLWGQDELTNSCFYHVQVTLFFKIISLGSILLQVDVAFHDLCHPGTSVIISAV